METNVIAVNFKNKHIVDTEPLTFEEVSRLAREQAETVPSPAEVFRSHASREVVVACGAYMRLLDMRALGRQDLADKQGYQFAKHCIQNLDPDELNTAKWLARYFVNTRGQDHQDQPEPVSYDKPPQAS
jgi:hypothetical protein